jgi:outer membrane usher protein
MQMSQSFFRKATTYIFIFIFSKMSMATEVSTVNVEIKGSLDAITGEIHPKLNVSGTIKGDKTLLIKQKGFVFYMQSLKEGEFLFHRITPFFLYSKLTVVLKNNLGESQSIDIHPIPSQSKALVFQDAGNMRIERIIAANPTKQISTPKEITKKTLETADAVATAAIEEQEFDLSFINRGRDKNINQNIVKNLNQIIPGRYAVDLVLNEQFISKIDVNFTRRELDGDAKACLTAQHIFLLGIKTDKLRPKGTELLSSAKPNATQVDSQASCLYIDEWVEKSSEKYDKGELVLSLSVPQAFISKSRRQAIPASMLTFGETAGFTNYAFNSFQSSYQGFKNSGQFLNLDSGLNVMSWQLRQSSFINANSTSKTTVQTGDLSANKTLIDWKSRLSLGAISSQSPVIGAVPVNGIRISSEEALYPDEERNFRPVVKGFARTNARIKIKQNTVVFFEQNVPPGPFEFTDLNPVSNIGDLQVTVSESDGTEQNFIVPYSNTYGKLNKGSIRYNITAGTYRDNYQTSSSADKALLQSYIRYGLNDFFTPALDSLVSSNFQSLGTQFNFGNFLGSQSFNVKTSRLTGSRQAQGQQYSININSAPIGPLTFGSNLSYQSKYFLEANTGLSNYSSGSDFSTTNTLKSTRNLYTNLNLDQWGGLSLNLTQQDAWSRNNINQNLNINYSIRIKKANVTTSLGRAKNNFGDNANRTLDSVSLNVSMPLELFSNRGNLSAYISQSGSSPVSENVYYNGNYADDINYSLSQSKQSTNVSQSVSLNLSHALGYSSLGYANSQAGSSSTSFGTSGGVVFHRGGLIASPPLGETFGILEVPGGDGVRAAGSKSTINRSGYGVVPNLSAYAMNIVDLDLSQAPLDVELESTSQRIAPVSGAIAKLTYASITGRPLLVHFSGQKIPFGATVMNDEGDELGTLGPGNRGLIRVKSDKGVLKVTWGDKPEESCSAAYEVKPVQKTMKTDYTLLDLVCQH